MDRKHNQRNSIMNDKKNLQNVWSAFTWLLIVTLILSGCGSLQKAKVYHVGLMSYGTAFTAVGDGIKEKMTELGYIEGQNVVYETRIAGDAADDAEELRLAKELVDAKVDVLVAFPSPSVVAAIEAAKGTNIPVIFVYYPI